MIMEIIIIIIIDLITLINICLLGDLHLTQIIGVFRLFWGRIYTLPTKACITNLRIMQGVTGGTDQTSGGCSLC
jgi:hypothetical protein